MFPHTEVMISSVDVYSCNHRKQCELHYITHHMVFLQLRIPLKPYQNNLSDFIQPAKAAVLKDQFNQMYTFSIDMTNHNYQFTKAIRKK